MGSNDRSLPNIKVQDLVVAYWKRKTVQERRGLLHGLKTAVSLDRSSTSPYLRAIQFLIKVGTEATKDQDPELWVHWEADCDLRKTARNILFQFVDGVYFPTNPEGTVQQWIKAVLVFLGSCELSYLDPRAQKNIRDFLKCRCEHRYEEREVDSGLIALAAIRTGDADLLSLGEIPYMRSAMSVTYRYLVTHFEQPGNLRLFINDVSIITKPEPMKADSTWEIIKVCGKVFAKWDINHQYYQADATTAGALLLLTAKHTVWREEKQG